MLHPRRPPGRAPRTGDRRDHGRRRPPRVRLAAHHQSDRLVAGDGWFTVDFTLAELRTLRAVERIPATRPHNTLHDGREQILTFDEVLDVLDSLSRELGRRVGVLPEVKHSTFHQSIGLPVEPGLVDTLRRRGLDGDPT